MKVTVFMIIVGIIFLCIFVGLLSPPNHSRLIVQTFELAQRHIKKPLFTTR